MGSSLTVTPAAHIPKEVSKKGKLIIVNLQKTPLDDQAFFKINALCDDVMKRLAQKLTLKINDFVLYRQIQFKGNKEMQVSFRGVDQREIPFSFLKEVSVAYDGSKEYKKLVGEPFQIDLKKFDKAKIKLSFYKYLGEPDFEL